jgi:hypothetical protein
MTVLDTPEAINMWVLLSRRAQLKLWMNGMSRPADERKMYQTPGLVKWCKANIEGAENARTARDCIVPVEYAIASAGGPQDFSLVNVHVMRKAGGLFHDRGIYADMSEVEANPTFVSLYERGLLEIVYTLDEPREPNGQAYVPA